MATTPPLRIYEELANYYERQAQAQLRDRFLLLAADAALTAGQVEDAERLRRRLLEHSPHHMLKPFSSFSEAMHSPDVQGYLDDLRQSYPHDTAEELLGTLTGHVPTPPTPPPALKRPPAPPPQPAPPPPPPAESPFPTAMNGPFRLFQGEEGEPSPEPPPPPPPPKPAPKPAVRPAPPRPAPPPSQKAPPPAPELPRPAPAPTRPMATVPPPPPQPRPAPPAPRLQPPRPAAPAVREQPPPPRAEPPEMFPLQDPLPVAATPPPPPITAPQASIPLQRPVAPQRTQAQTQQQPPRDDSSGAWFSSALFGLVFLTALACLVYCLGKPFLPPQWMP